jgi:serine/threonine protein kinase
MAEYLQPAVFSQRYPTGRKLASGGYGDVYATLDDRYVVKIQGEKVPPYTTPMPTDLLVSTLRELNYYNRFDHPNIAKVVAWSYDPRTPGRTFIVIRKGENIVSAIRSGRTSLIQVAKELISAVAFLNTNGVSHRDIKDPNLIFLDGRVQLIDFGIAGEATMFNNEANITSYYFRGLAYTGYYRDPQYFDTEFNNINVEEYAIAKTLYSIHQLLNDATASIYATDINDIYDFKTGDPQIDKIIALCTEFPVSKRIPIVEVAKRVGASLTNGRLLETLAIGANQGCQRRPEIITSLGVYIVSLADYYNYTIRTAFLGVHLLHRSLPVIYPEYWRGVGADKFNIIAQICLFLATILEDQTMSFQDMMARAKTTNIDVFNETLVAVLVAIQGIIITRTYWDYTRYFEDLPTFLIDALACNYDPQKIRPGVAQGTSKFRTLATLLKDPRLAEVISTNRIEHADDTERGSLPKIDPWEQPPLYMTWDQYVNIVTTPVYYDQNPESIQFSLIARGYKPLADLSLTDAVGVYRRLRQSVRGRHLLTKIFGKVPADEPAFMSAGIQPFKDKWVT